MMIQTCDDCLKHQLFDCYYFFPVQSLSSLTEPYMVVNYQVIAVIVNCFVSKRLGLQVIRQDKETNYLMWSECLKC